MFVDPILQPTQSRQRKLRGGDDLLGRNLNIYKNIYFWRKGINSRTYWLLWSSRWLRKSWEVSKIDGGELAALKVFKLRPCIYQFGVSRPSYSNTLLHPLHILYTPFTTSLLVLFYKYSHIFYAMAEGSNYDYLFKVTIALAHNGRS